jgi:hypothetical protein
MTMATWKSFADLKRDLGLENGLEVEAVKKSVRQELSTLHPDRHGGKFESASDEERFHILTAALAYCESGRSTALVPVEDIPALVTAIAQAISTAQAPTLAQQRGEYRETVRADLHRHAIPMRIGSGVFAGVCTGLLAVSKQFADDPLLGMWIASPMGRLVLLSMALYAGIFFVMSWWSEQKQGARLEWLSTDEGRRAVLGSVLSRLSEQPSGALEFSYSDFVDAIQDRPRKRSPFSFASGRLSVSAAEKLANLHLSELEKNGAIRRLDGVRLEPRYAVDSNIRKELANHGR